MLRFEELKSFLQYYNKKNEQCKQGDTSTPPHSNELNHTRIGHQALQIYGASFCIPDEMMDEFHHHYYKHVFVDNQSEYLTERQLSTSDSPILIDLDFKYDLGVDSRQHSEENVFDIIFLHYLEKLKLLVKFDNSSKFTVYVTEKESMNRCEDKGYVKDGIHIIIGVKLSHSLQLVLRQMVLETLPGSVVLPFINDWQNIVDECIPKGSTNWQLFGSQKPGHLAYQLSYIYDVGFDEIDQSFMIQKRDDVSMTFEIFQKLSARYKDNLFLPIQESYTKIESIKSHHAKAANCTSLPYSKPISQEVTVQLSVEKIVDSATLDEAIDDMIKSLNLTTDYAIKETHDYAVILPAKFYEPGSHELNRKLAFALKNTDFRLFLTWIKVRSYAADFKYEEIPLLFSHWSNYFNKGDHRVNGLSKKSIIYWARDGSPEQYKQVKKKTIDFYVDLSLKSGTDYDYAKTIYQMYKHEYICTNVNSKPTWYRFQNHRWVKDKGNTLRLNISNTLYEVFEQKLRTYSQDLVHIKQRITEGELKEDCDELETKANILKTATKHIKKLKQCSDKNNIFRETSEIFFDSEFNKKMDKNKYLMCFSNGVVDFQNKTFRNGYPDDYITKSTNIDYIPFDMVKDTEICANIYDFMGKLFTNPSMRQYMYDHLSSCLLGCNFNQTFNIYRGRGSNGKSLLTDFMALTLGEYAGTVPVTLVTEKRSSIGGTQSELMQLKGVRYAVMQEPSKDAKINEGMMKQLTGDSHMTARDLYCDSETFVIQFDLVVCLNELFKISSNDNGTWRRIRVVDFQSRFVSPEDSSYSSIVDVDSSTTTQTDDYTYPKDPTLKDKLPLWAPTFASILVNRLFETEGAVEPCKEILEATDNYRRDQDALAEYYKQKLTKSIGNQLKMSELKADFNTFIRENHYSGVTSKDLIEYLKTFFKHSKTHFSNIGFVEEITTNNPEYTM